MSLLSHYICLIRILSSVFVSYLCKVDVLEYIHENEYVHADIKAANLMLCCRDTEKVRPLESRSYVHKKFLFNRRNKQIEVWDHSGASERW